MLSSSFWSSLWRTLYSGDILQESFDAPSDSSFVQRIGLFPYIAMNGKDMTRYRGLINYLCWIYWLKWIQGQIFLHQVSIPWMVVFECSPTGEVLHFFQYTNLNLAASLPHNTGDLKSPVPVLWKLIVFNTQLSLLMHSWKNQQYKISSLCFYTPSYHTKISNTSVSHWIYESGCTKLIPQPSVFASVSLCLQYKHYALFL